MSHNGKNESASNESAKGENKRVTWHQNGKGHHGNKDKDVMPRVEQKNSSSGDESSSNKKGTTKGILKRAVKEQRTPMDLNAMLATAEEVGDETYYNNIKSSSKKNYAYD